ncbi:MAG: hypothetical protein OHK0046_05760 [Anaerolineae bacterium]
MDFTFLNDPANLILVGGGILLFFLGIVAFLLTQVRFAVGCLGTFFMLLLLVVTLGAAGAGLYLSSTVFLPDAFAPLDTFSTVMGLIVSLVILGLFFVWRAQIWKMLRWVAIVPITAALILQLVRVAMGDATLTTEGAEGITETQVFMAGGVVVLLIYSIGLRWLVRRTITAMQKPDAAPAAPLPAVVKRANAAAWTAPDGEVIREVAAGATLWVIGRTNDGRWLRARAKQEVWMKTTDLELQGNVKALPVLKR